MADIIRVLRLIEYEGPRDLVEEQVKKSIHGTRHGLSKPHKDFPDAVRITAVTLGVYPEVIEEARRVPMVYEGENLSLRNQLNSALETVEQLNNALEEYGTQS